MSRPPRRHSLEDFRRCRASGRRFAMLTAYDYGMARAAQAAGVQALLIGDSLGTVVLGYPNTRRTPLELLVVLGEAVRRGAPDVYLVGDLPLESKSGGPESFLRASRRFRDEAGCDAVKFEAKPGDEVLLQALLAERFQVIVHLGLRPQDVVTADGYRAQARTQEELKALVAEARGWAAAGASMLLLEAVAAEAAEAVVAAVDVPVIGCGAGPACHGHVVVTHDLLGLGAERPPRFAPELADLRTPLEQGLRRWVADIEEGAYPRPDQCYHMKPASQPASGGPQGDGCR